MTYKTDKPKFCVNCLHCKKMVSLGDRVNLCTHPIHANPVNGQEYLVQCEYARSMNGKCYPAGLNWEPRP